MAPEAFDAVVVGGSIAGLMHGIVLKNLGRNVRVLESRQPRQLKAQAAGLSLGPEAQKLVQMYLPEGDPYACETRITQILSSEGIVLNEIPPAISVITSSWSVVFDRLRARFEEPEEGKGKTSFETGQRVTSVEDKGDFILVRIQGEYGGDEKTIQSKLVIAADGARSTIRSQVMADVKPEYSGYLAWRGCVPEAKTPEAMKGALDGKMIMAMLKGGCIISYLTPGLDGSTAPGERLLDWCWYEYCDGESPAFGEIMTDAAGHRHNQTVPRGGLSEKVWERQLAHAGEVLPAHWMEIVREADLPLVTAIRGFEGSKASFWGGKLLLAGEAFTQMRPHLGLGCNLPALQALTLLEVWKGEKALGDWENEVVEYAKEFALRSKAAGHFGMTGKWPEGYVPPYLRKAASKA